MSPRRLNGWEPTTTTVYEYEDGVLVRSLSTPEPEFADDDLDLMLASVAFEASIGRNGHLLSHTMSPEADPQKYEHSLRYVAHGPFWDWDEKVRLDDIDRYRAEFPKDSPPNLNGAYWVTEEIGELSTERVHSHADDTNEDS
ncbi:hypothetical protein E3T46_07660 [Cryobacterium sp. Hh11]|uniref:hypothetical protein n=1 Tax=Cryobacterium sp. Hh11 TaxID=2555868 RepID=UPI00106B5664|nr:hypothetical protein [Cryobacterium sp. Hh11]TFD51956.1 hypothetical protein E3T46_07660 [Cryobacterium sp. Hh11]